MEKKIPLRQCVGCGEMKSKRDMMRILKTDGGLCLDVTGKKNGRGAYVCKSGECLKRARRNKGLERSFKAGLPNGAYDILEKEFENLGTR